MAETEDWIVISLITSDPEFYTGCQVIPEGSLFPMIYRVVYGPKPFFDCWEWKGFHCRPIQPWWEDERKRAEGRGGQKLIGQRNFTPRECRRTELGRVDGVPEFKVEWEGSPIPYPVLYTRKSRIVAYAEICAPQDLLGALWGDMAKCAAVAGGAGLLAAIIASPAAALPAFKEAFMACIAARLGDRADEIGVALSTRQEHGEWSRV
jgi:hypothetical protein